MPDFIYLASQSPRRRQLLEQLGIRHELLLPGDDEDAEAIEAVLPGEAPARYVQRVTGLKLEAALARLERRGLPPAAWRPSARAGFEDRAVAGHANPFSVDYEVRREGDVMLADITFDSAFE